ncbi:MAG TPA: ferritin-like domain-containing protein [Phycisphaerales bacterium]|nr:ferritin-like domain-containing protein [Phycisphaerales bacterium]
MHIATPLSNAVVGRRRLLGSMLGAGAGFALVGCASAAGQERAAAPQEGKAGKPKIAGKKQDLDAKIMTFALNLEYMEAEYYTRGAFGRSLREQGTDTGKNPGEVRGGHQVHFSNKFFRDHAEELAFNEAAHVKFYREKLGNAAVDMPAIDFEGGFTAAAVAAGIIPEGEKFDPFADEVSFFLGGMLFEDVGVTAYHGAAPLITSKEVLDAAAGILAVEAYHMGMARHLILHSGPKWTEAANKISDARDKLDGMDDLDQPILMDGKANIVPNDKNGIAFKRTPRQVLNIVYLQRDAMKGGFYPNGMNGDFAGLV